jgi:hypothetical protein
MYYFHYISRADFHAFHAPCTSRVVDGGGCPLFYGVFLASIHAIVAFTALSYCRYIHGFVVPEFLNFL